MAPQNKWFAASPNTDYIYKALTDGTVTNLTGGRIPKMNATQAAGLVGSWLIETGRKDLSNLDVVEAGSGRGRGLSQYTGVRRTPYDQAVQQAKAAGKDPNSAQWQIEYFAREYMNRDLIGWTKVFEKMPQNLKSPGEYAKYFTGSAAEGKGYFRPGTPHTDRRMQAAMEVYNHYVKGQGAPKPSTPATQPTQQGQPNLLDGVLQKLGIKGGSQSFNTDKLQRVIGAVAANTPVSDIGFAIFSSQKGVKNPQAAWKNLDNNTRKAYGQAGASLAISANPNYQLPKNPYSMPKNLTIGSGSQNYGTNVGPKATFDSTINTGSTSRYSAAGPRDIGGLPSLGDIAQAGIANYNHFKGKSSSYGQQAYSMGSSTIGRINSQSYGGTMNLGGSLGINTSATAAAGARYGGTAMGSGFNAGAVAAAGYGYSQ